MAYFTPAGVPYSNFAYAPQMTSLHGNIIYMTSPDTHYQPQGAYQMTHGYANSSGSTSSANSRQYSQGTPYENLNPSAVNSTISYAPIVVDEQPKWFTCQLCTGRKPVQVPWKFVVGHISHHLNYLPISCVTCGKTFGSMAVFEWHITDTKHPEKYSVNRDKVMDDLVEKVYHFLQLLNNKLRPTMDDVITLRRQLINLIKPAEKKCSKTLEKFMKLIRPYLPPEAIPEEDKVASYVPPVDDEADGEDESNGGVIATEQDRDIPTSKLDFLQGSKTDLNLGPYSQNYGAQLCKPDTSDVVDHDSSSTVVDVGLEEELAEEPVLHRMFASAKSDPIRTVGTDVEVENDSHSNSDGTELTPRSPIRKSSRKRNTEIAKPFDEFHCDVCQYFTKRSGDFNKHLNSKKHKDNTFVTEGSKETSKSTKQSIKPSKGTRQHIDQQSDTKHDINASEFGESGEFFRFRCDMCPFSANLRGNFTQHLSTQMHRTNRTKDHHAETKITMHCDSCALRIGFETVAEHVRKVHGNKKNCLMKDDSETSRVNLTLKSIEKSGSSKLPVSKPRKRPWSEIIPTPQSESGENGLISDYSYDAKAHRKRRFRCNRCNATRERESYMRNHMIVHSNRRPFKCKLCSLDFKCSRYLKVHVNNMHGSVVVSQKAIYREGHTIGYTYRKNAPMESRYKCRHCELAFPFKCRVVAHLKVHASDGSSLSYGERCSKLSTKVALIKHKNVKYCSTERKPELQHKVKIGRQRHTQTMGFSFLEQSPKSSRFRCNQCGTRKSSRTQIESHIKTHSLQKSIKSGIYSTSLQRKVGFWKHWKQRYSGRVNASKKTIKRGVHKSVKKVYDTIYYSDTYLQLLRT